MIRFAPPNRRPTALRAFQRRVTGVLVGPATVVATALSAGAGFLTSAPDRALALLLSSAALAGSVAGSLLLPPKDRRSACAVGLAAAATAGYLLWRLERGRPGVGIAWLAGAPLLTGACVAAALLTVRWRRG